jgi:Family of unknown function (DUF6328)
VSKLQDKLENALNEARILILGGQVLIGAAFRSIFADGFDKLPFHTQAMHIATLWFMAAGLGLLITPASYHFIVECGENTARVHELVTSLLEWALLPFALGLGASVFMVAEKTMTTTIGAISGGFTAILAVSIWYILSVFKRKQQPPPPEEEPIELTAKIKEALIETRMVLPGAQALLGFQVANTFTNSFDQLPFSSRAVHLASLVSIAVCAIFLMAPAAYHRIAEHGEDSEEFYRLSGRFLLLALFWLALGLAGDLWVVTRKILHSDPIANFVGIAALVFFYGLWFGYSAQQSWSNETKKKAA